MAISTLYRLDKITGPVALSEVTQRKINSGIKSMIETPAGHTHPMFRSNQEQMPVIEFGTPELATLLAAAPLMGGVISGTPLVAWLKKASTGSNVARATTQHAKVTVNLGFFHWTSISLPSNGRGEANCVVTASYDGTNDPLVYATGVALSGNLTATEYFCGGPVYVNGSQIPGVKSINIDSGIELVNETSDGEVWPTFVGLQMTKPSVTITTKENVWGTLGLQGLALDGTNGLKFFAKKYSSTARVANATTSHIKFQAIDGFGILQDEDGSNSDTLGYSMKFELISITDSAIPLVITTSSAIS